MGGAEQQAMHGTMGRLFGKFAEEMFFQGDQSAWNPMRYLPTPFHTKFAQERTALSQYIQQEAVGTRMRRWERPIHDMLAAWGRGAVSRATGVNIIPGEVQHRRDLDTLADMFEYLRAETRLAGSRDIPGTWVTFIARFIENERTTSLRPFPHSATFLSRSPRSGPSSPAIPLVINTFCLHLPG